VTPAPDGEPENRRAEVISLEAYQQDERELMVEEARRAWIIHAAIYVAVNAVLILVDVLACPTRSGGRIR
jgi:hypothetical protein